MYRSRHHCRRLMSLLAQFCLIMLALLIQTVELSTEIKTPNEAAVYLKAYGYLPGDQSSSIIGLQSDLRSALIEFQRFARLKPTGELNEETLVKMNQRRCGVRDIDHRQGLGRKRRRRFAASGSSWLTNKLKYFFHNYASTLSNAQVRSITQQAIKLWSSASGIEFTETTNSTLADMRLQYSKGDHNDGFAFDGDGGVLAHTFYPPSGEIHFDDDETWTDKTDRGINLLQVTTHEFGHALGLGHSDERDAVMQPFYGGYNPNFKLGSDDISGIQSIYGKFNQTVTSTTPSSPVSTTTRSGSASCSNSRVDAIVSVNQTTYVFFGNQYMILDYAGCCSVAGDIRSGFPGLISSGWPGLVNAGVDAALYLEPTSTNSGHLYIFAGQRYWRYSNLPSTTIDSGYPRSISSGFPGVPNNIDSAFVWGKNKRIYFIKGSDYYRYTENAGVDRRYPKPLSLWSKLPTNQRISAAFLSPNTQTYFFSEAAFYEFDDFLFQARAPKSTARYIFNCT